jgi:hypothetical protein
VTSHVPLGDDWALWPAAALRGAGLPFDWLDWLAQPADGAGRGGADQPADGAGPGSAGPGGAAPGGEPLALLLREPAFTTALTWQNPHVMRTWAGAWAEAARAGRRLGKEANAYRSAVLARYAQRYCAKNDSIGFFGPVGWARLGPAQDAAPAAGGGAGPVAVTGGAGIRWGDVFFEHWAIAEIARAFESDERVRLALPAKLHPAVSCDDSVLRRPLRPPERLTDDARAVLALVDGVRPAGEVARRAGADGAAELARLEAAGVVRTGFVLPSVARPDDELRAQLDAIGDGALRAGLLARLDALEQCRSAVAKSGTDPVALGAALDDLDAEFARLTGRPARREKGQAVAGRTLVYLDCRRDADVVIGGELLDALAPPLKLLLQSARWFTAQLAAAAEDALMASYEQLSRRDADVPLSDLHFAASALLTGAPRSPVHDVAADFGLRWTEILGLDQVPQDTAEIALATADIEPLVMAMFPAQAPGWAAARYHSPDLMLDRSPDGTGFRWVLGELHLAMNTLESRFFHTLADDPEELAALTATDMAGGRIVPCYPPGPVVDSRRYPPLAVHVPGRYLYWSYGDDAGAPGGARSVPATALSVRVTGGRLVAGPRNGGWELPVTEFFGEFLTSIAVNHFRLPVSGTGGPRIVLDDVVIRRRSWSLGAGDLPAGSVSQRGYRPDVIAAALTARGLPRRIFARTPLEPKPFYADLRAPLLVNNLARSWRKLPADGRLIIEEMLPEPAGLWLRDSRGRPYTSEFRLVAVDQSPLPSLAVPDGQARPDGQVRPGGQVRPAGPGGQGRETGR